MSSAIDQMMQEHRQIETVIAALEDFCNTLQTTTGTEKERLGEFVEFLSVYVDELHHGKEENILFKAISRCGFNEKEGPIAAMLIEHDQGRRFIEILRVAASQHDSWNTDDRERVFEAGMGYSALLSEHIMKEDEIIYPMARQILPPESMADVDSECGNFDTAKHTVFKRMLHISEKLVERISGE